MRDEPDPAHFARFCTEILPGMLEVCEVPVPDVALVVEDVSLRAEAVARMDPASREILAAPFYEESFSHEPEEAPAWMKAPLAAGAADNPFVELAEAYPRAWACLEALRTCLNCGGGRIVSARAKGFFSGCPQRPDPDDELPPHG